MAKQKKAKKTKNKIEGQKCIRLLEFDLTDTQKADKADEAAELSEQVLKLTVEKKTVTKEFTSKIGSKQSSIDTLLAEIRAGKEKREEECIEVKNYNENQVEYYLDNKLVEKREMEPEERQDNLFEEKPKRNFQKLKMNEDQGYPEIADPVDTESQEIQKVHKEATSKKTASSALDSSL